MCCEWHVWCVCACAVRDPADGRGGHRRALRAAHDRPPARDALGDEERVRALLGPRPRYAQYYKYKFTPQASYCLPEYE